jgi:hypothetical protein
MVKPKLMSEIEVRITDMSVRSALIRVRWNDIPVRRIESSVEVSVRGVRCGHGFLSRGMGLGGAVDPACAAASLSTLCWIVARGGLRTDIAQTKTGRAARPTRFACVARVDYDFAFGGRIFFFCMSFAIIAITGVISLVGAWPLLSVDSVRPDHVSLSVVML